MRRILIALAAIALLAAACQDKPIDPMKPKVTSTFTVMAML